MICQIYKYKIIAGSLFLGAEIVEKHFTILPKDKTKDGVVSANPNQLKEISKLCKLNKEDISSYVKENVPEIEEMKGNLTRELSDEELLNRDYYQGRFVSKVSDKEIFNTYGVGTITGVTLSQYFGERLELFVNPTFKYNITSTFKRPYAVDQNQYSTGLRLGFKQQIF